MDEGLYIVGDNSWSIDMQRYNFQFTGQKFFQVRGGKIVGQVKDVAYQSTTTDFWNAMEAVGGPSTYVLGGAFNCGKGTARPDRSGHAWMSRGAVPPDQYPEHGAGGALITLQETIERVLRLSKADACIVIARRSAGVNIRWAHNTVTTNGDADEAQLSVVSIVGRRVASVTRTHFPPERLEEMVRESEAACARRPEAPDYMPLPEGAGAPADWNAPPADADIHVFDPLVPQLARSTSSARRASIATFGYAESQTTTTLLATSTGLRRRHTERIGKVEITAKTPDFIRSSWVGQVTHDFLDIDLRAMFETLQQRLAWSAQRIAMPAGAYEVLLEPSCAADLAIAAYWFMTRRDADEGRSPYSRPGGGTRIGERLFGDVTIYSDPFEPGIEATPFSSRRRFRRGFFGVRQRACARPNRLGARRRPAESDHAAILGGEDGA